MSYFTYDEMWLIWNLVLAVKTRTTIDQAWSWEKISHTYRAVYLLRVFNIYSPELDGSGCAGLFDVMRPNVFFYPPATTYGKPRLFLNQGVLRFLWDDGRIFDCDGRDPFQNGEFWARWHRFMPPGTLVPPPEITGVIVRRTVIPPTLPSLGNNMALLDARRHPNYHHHQQQGTSRSNQNLLPPLNYLNQQPLQMPSINSANNQQSSFGQTQDTSSAKNSNDQQISEASENSFSHGRSHQQTSQEQAQRSSDIDNHIAQQQHGNSLPNRPVPDLNQLNQPFVPNSSAQSGSNATDSEEDGSRKHMNPCSLARYHYAGGLRDF